MTWRLYRYDQTGAPVVTGQTAKFNALLKACLADGFNAKTVTITRTGNTATASCTAHGFVTGQMVAHSGAGQAEYNVEPVVTVIDADTYTFPVSGAPATPATGTITAKFAGCGWSEIFTGTGKSVFQAGSGNRFPLRVDASGTNYPRVVAYESMSAVDTGVAAFPLEAQLAGGAYMGTSSTTDATARPWLVLADETCFYVWIGQTLTTAQGIAGSGSYTPLAFYGDFESYKVGDAFNTLILFASAFGTTGSYFGQTTTLGTAVNGHYLARSYLQTGGSITTGKTADYHRAAAVTGIGSAGAGTSYPDAVTGGMLLVPVKITEAVASVTRGVMPKLWAPLHGLPGACGDTFTGAGDLAGKTFLLLDCGAGSTRCRVALEIPTWW